MSIRVPIVGILLVAACATAAWLISRLDVPPSPTPSETAERSTTATGYTLPDSMILENDRVRLVRMPDSIPMPGVGARAPDFELTSLHGGRFELTEHVGEVVVLNFWATWCEPCHDEMPDLQMTHDSLGGRGVTVVGVSIDEEGRDVVHPFHQTYPVAFPLLLNGLDVAREYGAA